MNSVLPLADAVMLLEGFLAAEASYPTLVAMVSDPQPFLLHFHRRSVLKMHLKLSAKH